MWWPSLAQNLHTRTNVPWTNVPRTNVPPDKNARTCVTRTYFPRTSGVAPPSIDSQYSVRQERKLITTTLQKHERLGVRNFSTTHVIRIAVVKFENTPASALKFLLFRFVSHKMRQKEDMRHTTYKTTLKCLLKDKLFFSYHKTKKLEQC